MTKKAQRLIQLFVIVGLVGVVVALLLRKESELPKGIDPNRVVARVNGEPIYAKELEAGLPQTFAPMLRDARRMKLEGLIGQALMSQLLESEGITVPERDVKERVSYLVENPPSQSCGCCSYQGLGAYLEANYMTMKGLAESLRVEIGFDRYFDVAWQRQFPSEQARREYLASRREELEKKYAKVYQIFFNVFQNPNFQSQPDKVRTEAQKKAEQAYAMLEKGEDFSDVAGALSEDQVSAKKGGLLGCVERGFVCDAFTDVLFSLEPGTYSETFETPFGWHIIRREALMDDDIEQVLKDEFVQKEQEEVLKRLEANSKIERFL